MSATMISTGRRGLRLSSLALLAMAVLGACDSDRAIGPRTTQVPTAASLAKGVKGGTLAITIVDQRQNLVTTLTAQFTVASANGGPVYFAVDNGPGDTDPNIGRIRMSGLNGKYEVCQTVAPAGYQLASPPCQTVLVSAGAISSLVFVD